MKLSSLVTVLALGGFVAPVAMAKGFSKRPRAQKEHVLKAPSGLKRGSKKASRKAAKLPVEARKRRPSGNPTV